MWVTLKKYSKYEINMYGNVRNRKTLKFLKVQKCTNVLYYSLTGDDGKIHTEYVHKLLASTFLENPNGYTNIGFKDENPYNITIDNLYWVESRENRKRRNYKENFSELTYKKKQDKIINYYNEISRLEEEIACFYEQWIPMKGFSLYEISRSGKIRNKNNKRERKPVSSTIGYHTLTLKNDEGKMKLVCIHRAVAEHFIPNPNQYKVVNHIDENKYNNDVLNLEWINDKQNLNHGTSPERIAEIQSIPINEYDRYGKYIRTWKNIKSFADFYGICGSSVSKSAKYQKGFCVGKIVKRYDGNRKDLIASEVRKRGRFTHPKKIIDDSKTIPINMLYVERKIDIAEIFHYYENNGTISYKKLRHDVDTIFAEICRLKKEIKKYDRA